MLRHEKAIVRDFYECFGWRTDPVGTYNDTAAFVDLRPVLSSYYHATQLRVKRFLRPTGRYFLDAGSGPLSQDEYLLYSADYTFRVCLDLSARALAAARDKLQTRGLYVIGDLGQLPFRDGTFDAALASHVLYHLPEDEQAAAVHELYRTLRSGGTCVILYIWPAALGTTIRASIARARRALAPVLSRRSSGASTAASEASARTLTQGRVPPLYFHPHDYAWVRRTLPDRWTTDIRVWRSVGPAFTRALIADHLLGGVLLRIIYWLEERFPHASARVGRYPMIVIRKAAGSVAVPSRSF
jgi:ubiquinone/menaquinone biosynthesis C-methylase UbiE